jgi:lipoyl(octanoyl) transferase
LHLHRLLYINYNHNLVLNETRILGKIINNMEWKVSTDAVGYTEAVRFMEQRVADIRAGKAAECVWLVEHPPLYTAGTSAKAHDLLNPQFPVLETGRGGEYTYHGPGQRVAYVMLDLKRWQHEPDIKKYVWQLEEWIIRTLAEFGITGERREGRVGIWVEERSGSGDMHFFSEERDSSGKSACPQFIVENKIAAIGVRIRHWVSYHGIAINVDPDLSHYDGIVPCGIKDHGVTSMRRELGRGIEMKELDQCLRTKWDAVFEIM